MRSLVELLERLRCSNFGDPRTRRQVRASRVEAGGWFMQMMVDNEKALMTRDEIEDAGWWID